MSNNLSVSDITPLGERPADVWRGRTGTLGAGVFTIAGSPITGTPAVSGDVLVYDSATDSLVWVNDSTFGVPLTVEDEGTPLATAADTLNFVGAGVTATGSGGTKTITIPGGASLWINVKDYGATGNGSTDDTAAITSAISALTSAGKGVLYFPAGSYKTSGGFTISVPCLVLGDGMSGWDGSTNTVSQVDCTSSTAVLFSVTSEAVIFEKLALLNTSGGAPSAGSGVKVTNGYGFQMLSCSITGFWIDVDFQVGSIYQFLGCYFVSPVKYGLKLQNTSIGDEGDGKITDCWFYANTYAPDAAIRIESGGGIGITNSYINRKVGSTNYFNRGIDLANSTVTSQLTIYGVQIENVREDGIHIVSNGANTWDLISIVACGIHLYRSSATTARAISISSDTLGDINTVVIEDNNFKATASSSVAAISLTKVNNAVIGANLNDSNIPFVGYLSTSGCTAIYDQGGGVAAGVSITGTPSVGDVPIATSGTAAAWGPGSGVGPTKGTPATSYGTPAAGSATTYIGTGATISKPTAADVDFSANVTTNNVSTSAHGLTPILPNDATKYLDGTGAYSVPAGSSSGAAPAIPVWNVTFNGDGATTVFYLPAAPYDAFSIAVFVGTGRNNDWTISGAMLDVLTFGTAPTTGTNNISIDIMAAT